MRPAIGRSVNCLICSILHGPSSGFYRAPVEATMPTRACRIVAVTTGVLLAALGLLAFPSTIFVLWITAVVFIGPAVAMGACCARPKGNVVPVGVAAVAATMAFSAILAGLIFLLGPPLAVPLLLTVTGTWGWRHRRSLRDDIGALLPTPRGSSTPKHPKSPPPRPPRKVSPVELRNDITSSSPSLLVQRIRDVTASTPQLCGAWQRSYWLVRELPPGPIRYEVVLIRHELLNELERRDPTGFHRWLETEPRAGSHPGRYLHTER